MAEKVAAIFAKFLGSKEKLKKYAVALKAGKAIADKADDIRGMQEAQAKLVEAFAPLKVPLQLIAAAIGSEVTAEVINLMNTMIYQMKDESFQKGVQYLTLIIELILNNWSKLLAIVNNLEKMNWQWDKWTAAFSNLLNVMPQATLNLAALNQQLAIMATTGVNTTTSDPLSTPVEYTLAPESDLGVQPPTGDGGGGSTIF